MKILVIGSGGREHALAWKIAQSPHVKKLFCAPGNPGTRTIAENVKVSSDDLEGLLSLALEKSIDLTVVGPEGPLAAGIVDLFESKGLRIFGPTRSAAVLEGSKVFAKEFMSRHQIPTGDFKVAETLEQAMSIIESGIFPYPLVVKADGLAAGKGAVICGDREHAEATIRDMMEKKVFGDAGNRVLVEEFLRGKEMSFIVICDGIHAVPLVTTMDHKAVYDEGKGPNTGGMGAISPSPYTNSALFDEVMQTIVLTTITRMLEEGRKIKGVLYVGLMLTDAGPRVLEYNCRFGDPETQPQMMRLESDLVEILTAGIDENLDTLDVKWSSNTSGCVVLASGGYPLHYDRGFPIEGLEAAAKIPGIAVFHAGTAYRDGRILTNGGRVLNVCAAEKNLTETMTKIYETIPRISFTNMFFRTDIGIKREDN
ncbi:MAG: phosphoribosylamine--glycine ligase [Candidatus Aminicenantes bacterium]|nr:phosphoribosylamine--glycine ligase [Candidatus Aminicenantes bacterium]